MRTLGGERAGSSPPLGLGDEVNQIAPLARVDGGRVTRVGGSTSRGRRPGLGSSRRKMFYVDRYLRARYAGSTMSGRRHSARRRLSILVFTTLLLVLGCFAGHMHADAADHGTGAHACALCIIAHHAPLARGLAVKGPSPILESVEVPSPPVRNLACPARIPFVGRGPPPAPLRVVG